MVKEKSTKEKDKEEEKNDGFIAGFLNRILNPVAESYRDTRDKLVGSIKKKAPVIYDEIESILKSHLVLLDKKKPHEIQVTDLITSSVIKQLPNIDEAKVREVIKKNGAGSFMNLLAAGFGAPVGKEKDYTVIKKERLFKKVLIANRGEIALRIIRACKELGVQAEIVYTLPDKDSLAVKFADKAHIISTSSGYLDLKKIVDIAKKTKADAIHPGYGFLAENSEFAKLCEKNKINFIGPTSKTISMLGDKVRAREKMYKSGVPVLPGTPILKNKKQALKISNKIGYPVILKAVAGGGGRGMRIVRNDSEMDKFFDIAESEAKNAFGNKSIFLEKYMESPKHIEFQILADKYGKVVHLGERDCTIQRKHQKLIEEAPSIALTKELRGKMGESAVKAVSAAKYLGAGTVEFLLDKDKNYYFIEMNTRIQVEHGITEAVTGVDLVKEQIKLASGAKLAFKQEDIKIEGYAIECRINAEDPSEDFTPSTGTIYNYLPPGGPGVRIGSICHPGYKVLPNFDSLLSLLICYGSTREEAIIRMRRALKEYIIEGVNTTIPFHRTVLRNKDFVKGDITTSFIEDSDILSKLKTDKKQNKKLTKEEKVILVTTAVTEYMKRKKDSINVRQENWINAARHENIQNEDAF